MSGPTREELVAVMVKGLILHHHVDQMKPAREARELAELTWEHYRAGRLQSKAVESLIRADEYECGVALDALLNAGYEVRMREG